MNHFARQPVLFLSFFLLSCSGLFAQLSPVSPLATPKEITEHQERLRAALKYFDALILGGPVNGTVKNIYSDVRPTIAAGKVQFQIDSTKTNVVDGILINQDGQHIKFEISIGIMRVDKQYPGFLFGYLCEGTSLLRAALKASSNPYHPDTIQKFYDAMDALYLHAVFLRDFQGAMGRNLHPFETYLVQSLENDTSSGLAPMSGASMYVLGIDAQLIYSFAELGGQAQQGFIDGETYLNKVIKLSDRLTETLKQAHTGIPKASDGKLKLESRYISEVSALSLLSYGVAIANTNLARFYPKADGQNAPSIGKLNASLDALQASASSHTSSLAYRETFIHNFGL